MSWILHKLWNVQNYIYVLVLHESGRRRAGHTDYLLMSTYQPSNVDKYCPKQIVSLVNKPLADINKYTRNSEQENHFQSKTIKSGKMQEGT